MKSSSLSEASTSGRSIESKVRTFGSEEEVGVYQFLGPKSQVIKKESLFDTVTQEETELEAVLEDLGISRKKRVKSRVDKVLKSQLSRLMTSVDGNKKKGTDGERQANFPKAPGADCAGLLESIMPSKLARALPKRQMLKRVKVVEDQPVVEDDWKEVEEKARLAALHREEEMSRMAARLMKGICLRVEEERDVLKRKKVELERNVARLKSDLSKKGKRLEALKASQVVEINKLEPEVKVDLEEVVAERDRFRRHLMSKGYFKDEVNAIRDDTYVEEDKDEETEDITIGIVDGLDGVSPLTLRDNQGDGKKCPEFKIEKKG
ncbi:hypothetical protein GIB67_015002 [Kingdonia uniflora]|uniref:Uncharacterized protein n=1 Tax=Kingdonia uniflora TaxID=39325 RepID=A0A7J7MU45_9MAGN|nr:hypothetical protein GIB67_015002 [Kingdonia uniflora]